MTRKHSQGIGAAVVRREDHRLLTGAGRFAADLVPDGACHAAMVRSAVSHADIVHIDASAALSLPGVLAVLTGKDAEMDGLRPIPHAPDWQGPPDAVLRMPEGFEVTVTEHSALPARRVRFVGEPVAVVVAETADIAQDAAELVDVGYETLPSVVDAIDALDARAPQLWPGCNRNLALDCEVGDEAATEAQFRRAAHVVSLDSHVHRVNGTPMELRSVVGTYDSATDHYTLIAASGRGAVQTRARLAHVLGVEPEQCRAVFGDMGGNFGTRNAFSPEFALIPWASRRVGRTVAWTADRRECFLSDYQARDTTFSAELALDEDGRFLAMRGTNTLNLGAYTVYFWPLRKGLSMMQGTYRIPAVHFHGRAVLTNTAPTAVYRSAGRPEAIYVIERLIDKAARQFGFDRARLRRQNLIEPEAMPFVNAVGVTYDSGEYAACMDRALSASDWSGFAERRTQAGARGKCRGIAVANYIEVTSGIPRERAELRPLACGDVELVIGTMSSGQGHETSFCQVVADWLDLPLERIRFVANDTDRVTVGGGSHSGRSMRLASLAIDEAVANLLEQASRLAAHALQAPVENIEYRSGQFAGPGGAAIGLGELATAALVPGGPPDISAPLEGIGDITNRRGGYPYGAHVCEVEVDADTGDVTIVDWTCVDDVGRAVNPLILHGQAHGATAQGIGQALMEAVRYEAGDAQLLTGSFMDYAMPRASTTPPFRTIITECPASSHPHGIRPGGEGGTTPALGVLINAVVDALAHLGVEHVEMPATPERVWNAVRAAASDPSGATPESGRT